MTKAEIFALTVERCNAALERELEAAEIVLVDQGATAQELEAALGPGGYTRKMLEADRDAQITQVARWLSGTLH
jgi:hypothetical protein